MAELEIVREFAQRRPAKVEAPYGVVELGTRDSVLQQLHATNIRNGIVGPIRFDHNGDLINGPITILRLQAGGHAVPDPVFANTVVDRVITPPASMVP